MDAHDIKWIIRRILFFIAVISVVVGSTLAYTELQERARHLAEQHARALMTAVDGLEAYTRAHVIPLVNQLPSDAFHPEAEPSFAAQQAFHSDSGHGEGFKYRTPALNPTSATDHASPFEVELIHAFRDHAELTELAGVTDTPQDRLYYLARPIRIDNEVCMRCHSTPDKAPPAMLALYGTASGFGWKMGEVVGIQLLTIPVTAQFGATLRLVLISAGCIVVTFVICYAVLSTTLNAAVVRPLQDLAQSADSASIAAGKGVRLPTTGAAELRRLAAGIERLRLSLIKTMARLSEAEAEVEAMQQHAAQPKRDDLESKS